jgi:hypothetical protein
MLMVWYPVLEWLQAVQPTWLCLPTVNIGHIIVVPAACHFPTYLRTEVAGFKPQNIQEKAGSPLGLNDACHLVDLGADAASTDEVRHLHSSSSTIT